MKLKEILNKIKHNNYILAKDKLPEPYKTVVVNHYNNNNKIQMFAYYTYDENEITGESVYIWNGIAGLAKDKIYSINFEKDSWQYNI